MIKFDSLTIGEIYTFSLVGGDAITGTLEEITRDGLLVIEDMLGLNTKFRINPDLVIYARRAKGE